MRNVLRPSTWKRLAFAVILAGVALIVPASPGEAGPVSPNCAFNQMKIRSYYRDAARTQPDCQDVISPQACRTYFCDPTPYYTDYCSTGYCDL
ncbi:MAG TPA: hypothetical protein VMW27_28330 [Thermoanaerobaculia bacterium]|nr:hypothetical protein [Thermoanaerobaculia bacterium]